MCKETMTDFSNQVQCNTSLYPAIYVTDGYKGEWIYANAPSVKALKASIANALGNPSLHIAVTVMGSMGHIALTNRLMGHSS